MWKKFLSTPSARRATIGVPGASMFKPISIHALREEGDVRTGNDELDSQIISIHALREEGDRGHQRGIQADFDFYPRPPRGGRRDDLKGLVLVRDISIHALREEGDTRPLPMTRWMPDFYPRPPRGGRPASASGRSSTTGFLSTPSARRATAKTETKSLFSNKLYNILHEFRRALIYNGSKSYPNHAK